MISPLEKRVIAHAKDGTPPREIAGLECIAQSRVYTILRAARKRGEDVPYFTSPRGQVRTSVPYQPAPRGTVEPPHNLVVGLRLFRLLEFAAKRRGVTPHELARDIIEANLLGTEAKLQIKEARHA